MNKNQNTFNRIIQTSLLALAFALAFTAPSAHAQCTQTVMGISNACLWLKADQGAGTGTLATWTDQSGNGVNLTGVGSPSIIAGSNTTGMNFNPVVRFNGSTQLARNTSVSSFGSSAGEISIFLTAKENVRKATFVFGHHNSSDAGEQRTSGHYAWFDSNIYWEHGTCCSGNANRTSVAAPFAPTVPSLGFFFNSASASISGIDVNGLTRASNPAAATVTGMNRTYLGGNDFNPDVFYNGDIPEYLQFGKALTAAERIRVQSYLALKYGLTLVRSGLSLNSDFSYTSGNGAKVFNDSGTFWNSVFGIGRDTVTGLDQRVSRSAQKLSGTDLVAGDSPMTLATSADFTSANGGARPALDDGQYLVAGDNNATTAFTSTWRPGVARMNRVWRFQNTGGVGDVFPAIPATPTAGAITFPTGGSPVLLVETSAGTGTFDTATTTAIPLANVGGFWVPVDGVGSSTPQAVTIADGSFVSYATATISISGTIQHDDLGNGTTNAARFTTGAGANQVRVFLYDSAGAFVKEADAYGGADGTYIFVGLPPNATFYVRANHPTALPDGSVTGLLAEQTWASGGTGQDVSVNPLGGTLGGGPICVGDAPGYTQQTGTTVTAWSAKTGSGTTGGTCFGGRLGAVANTNITASTALTDGNSEHITRVVAGTADVTDVGFGFSFNVVTWVGDVPTNLGSTGQGSIRGFYANANAIPGANAMRFVPAVVPNGISGGNSWWEEPVPGMGLTITGVNGEGTTVDGRAFSNVNGSTQLNTNAALIGTGGTVGVDGVVLAQVPGPEYAFRGTNSTAGSGARLISDTNNVTFQHLGLYGLFDIAVHVSGTASNNNLNNLVIGVLPDSMVDPGAALRTQWGIQMGSNPSAVSGSITNSFVGFSAGSNISLTTTSAITMSGLEVVGAGPIGDCQGNIDVLYNSNGQFASSSTASISLINSLVRNGNNSGYRVGVSQANSSLINNTFSGNGTAACNANHSAGVMVNATPPTTRLIERNVFSNNVGAGVQVTTGTGWRITRNHFEGNGRNSIDLGVGGNGVTNNPTALTGSNCPFNANGTGTANNGLPRPQINSASLSGTSLTVSGFACNSGAQTIEIYEATSGNGDFGSFDGVAEGTCTSANGPESGTCRPAGEGSRFLGTLTAASGSFSGTLTDTGLTNASRITAISIDGSDNTSEFSISILATQPSLSAIRSVSPASADPGATVEHNITTISSSEGSVAQGVVLDESLPAFQAFVADAFGPGQHLQFEDDAINPSGLTVSGVFYSEDGITFLPMPGPPGWDSQMRFWRMTLDGDMPPGSQFNVLYRITVD